MIFKVPSNLIHSRILLSEGFALFHFLPMGKVLRVCIGDAVASVQQTVVSRPVFLSRTSLVQCWLLRERLNKFLSLSPT